MYLENRQAGIRIGMTLWNGSATVWVERDHMRDTFLTTPAKAKRFMDAIMAWDEAGGSDGEPTKD